MNELQFELLKLKAHTYDAIKQLEVCKLVITQNATRIEEIEKEIRHTKEVGQAVEESSTEMEETILESEQ